MSPHEVPARADVIVIGAGHNGLVAATLLGRAGLDVVVLEARDVVGGAARTETPFPRVPGLRQSTGAYLLGLMPPELAALLDLDLPLVRRDPHYFLPTTGTEYLLAGRAGTTGTLLSDADRAADARLQSELAALREDLAPAWLAEPLGVAETADRYVRPTLRQAFVHLVEGSVVDYLDRFGFSSELIVAMYAVTDGLSGVAAGPDTPGTGHNFLVHNMCRLPGADGTWMLVRGGMGTVTGAIADRAHVAGVRIVTDAQVDRVLIDGGQVRGVVVGDRTVDAPTVLGACDPFRLSELARDVSLPIPPRRNGTTMKVNLALRELPEFACLPPGAPSPFGSTIHLIEQDEPLLALRQMWADVVAGRLPDFPTIEWYVHTTLDPSLQDDAGHHSSALFVQSVPHQPAGGSWDEPTTAAYVEHLLAICDRFAPGTSTSVADVFALPPPGIAAHFAITGGHIHHVDNTIAFADRMPYGTGIDGLYAGSAGCHPAGSVIGAAGHNAAQRILRDLELSPRRPLPPSLPSK